MNNYHKPILRTAELLIILSLTICLFPGISNAQFTRIEIPSSLNPVGSGARALGMGGAFIAVADDATAASWNPGGLIQLETPEISIVGAYFDRTESNSFETDPDADKDQKVTNSNINYLSAAYPFTAWNRNMIVSASHQYLYDFNRKLEYPTSYQTATFVYRGSGEMQHEGGLSAIGIAYAVQATPNISFGITFNFWQDGLYDNELKSEVNESGSGVANGNNFTFDATSEDTFSYRGYNANLGLMWNVTSQLTFGLVFKTPFTADIEHSHKETYDLNFPNNPVLNRSDPIDEDTDEEIDFPMSYGIGLAYRFSDAFTLSFDIYRTEWDDYKLTNEDGDEISPITGEPSDEVDVDPTHQVRAGAEYLLVLDSFVVPLRAGLFYDPAPADGKPDDFYGFSCGTGLAKGKIIFDLAYQYRFGADVSEYILEESDFSQEMQEHTIYTSFIYHF